MPPFVRTLAERLARGVVFPARLPARFGGRTIWLSPGNLLEVLKPGEAKFGTYLLGFAERFVGSGDVVWDIGANMGIFTLPAAHRARFTLAIEPDPFNQQLLHRTMAANEDLAIDVLPAAISNAFGVAKFNVASRGRAANSLADAAQGTQMGGIRQQLSVLTVTADWVLERFPAPNLVKIDAEGAEALILEGARRLLSDARPAIIIEMANANADACAGVFAANDYAMVSAYEAVDPTRTVSDVRDLWEIIAIPREKLSAFAGK